MNFANEKKKLSVQIYFAIKLRRKSPFFRSFVYVYVDNHKHFHNTYSSYSVQSNRMNFFQFRLSSLWNSQVFLPFIRWKVIRAFRLMAFQASVIADYKQHVIDFEWPNKANLGIYFAIRTFHKEDGEKIKPEKRIEFRRMKIEEDIYRVYSRIC